MTRRARRRATCPRPRTPIGSAPAALRVEVGALRRRIEALWSAVLLGEELPLRDVHAVALALAELRLRIDRSGSGLPGPAVADVIAARDDLTCCVVAVADLLEHFTAA